MQPGGAGQGKQGETQSQRKQQAPSTRRRGRQAALPCTLTHSGWLKALCRPMAFTNVRAFTQYAAPGSTISRYTGRTPDLTTLTCSFRKPKNSHTLSEAGQEKERRREGTLLLFPFCIQNVPLILSFVHSFIFKKLLIYLAPTVARHSCRH